MSTQKISIINTGCANIASVKFALQRIGIEPIVTADPAVFSTTDKVILPGVGTAKHAMHTLQETQLVDAIQALTQPVLGICLGMQLLTQSSSEGNVECLKQIPLHTTPLITTQLPLPHMGWNQLKIEQDHPLFTGINDQDFVYFVHRFAVEIDSRYCLASSEYGTRFAASIAHNNFIGVQFHPERSATVGAKILTNFLELC